VARAVAERADVVMSVCAGAYILAEAGLLDGLTATTHHGSHADIARTFPTRELVTDERYVEHDRIATAAGLTSGSISRSASSSATVGAASRWRPPATWSTRRPGCA
jgi:transcriptional regulator GlxA family with amidase domain